VLTRSFQSDAANEVHPELFHAPEDVLHSHSDPTHSFVELLIGITQGLIAVGFAHQKFLGLTFDEIVFMSLGMVNAIAQDRVVTFINEILKDLAIVDLGGGRLVLVDEFTFGERGP
jgi:hypothetical protein